MPRGKPVLLVKGKDSAGFSLGTADLLSDAIGPSAKTIILPDGHACHIVAQDQFMAELLKLVEGSN